MNKKLLCTTALIGALVSGASLAEIKLGGNVTHTINFGSNEGASNSNEANERLGTEFNLTIASRADLNNGMFISYGAAYEIDGATDGGTAADLEYEIQIGQGNFYVGAGADRGNSLAASPTLPAVGFQPGTLAVNVGVHSPLNYDGFMGRSSTTADGTGTSGTRPNEVQDSSHLSLNYKALGGTFTYAYAPSIGPNENDNDHAAITTQGGSGYAVLYSGSPAKDVKIIIGRNDQKGDNDIAVNEVTTDKFGVSYNFGQFAAGVEYQRQENGTKTLDDNVMNYAVTFAATDKLTLGVQYSVGEDESTAGAADEKIKVLSAGYNLGPASIALSLVDAESLGTTDGKDSKGAVITTRFAF